MKAVKQEKNSAIFAFVEVKKNTLVSVFICETDLHVGGKRTHNVDRYYTNCLGRCKSKYHVIQDTTVCLVNIKTFITLCLKL